MEEGGAKRTLWSSMETVGRTSKDGRWCLPLAQVSLIIRIVIAF